jgi:hypothetical protein
MTGEQFLVLCGLIYLSHDTDPHWRRVLGLGSILFAVWLGLTETIS